jgi:hypothetical protein
MTAREATWQSDVFGTLNDKKPEPIAQVARSQEIMGSEPGYRAVRVALHRQLALGPDGTVVDAVTGSANTIVTTTQHATLLDRGRWLRHAARFVRWRPDRSPDDCWLEQLAHG